jgi:hypothetical protein
MPQNAAQGYCPRISTYEDQFPLCIRQGLYPGGRRPNLSELESRDPKTAHAFDMDPEDYKPDSV